MERRRFRRCPPLILCVTAGFLVLGLPAAEGAQEPAAEARTPLPDGVTPQITLAIERGLGYLVDKQGEDGSWLAVDDSYPVAMTALAGIALLSSGSTITTGPHARSIRRAADFLMQPDVQDRDGLFTDGERRPMFGHAFTMVFLGQILGQEDSLERRGQIQAKLRRAVDLTVRAQTAEGGWYYEPNDEENEGTLTVTQLQGLRACRDAGVHVPKAVVDKAVRFIEESANSDGSVRYQSSRGWSDWREGVTCASVVALWSAGKYEDPLLRRIVGFIDKNIQGSWGGYGRGRSSHTTYIQFYLGQAKFLLGGERWTKFYRDESRILLRFQQPDGSWIAPEEQRQHGVGEVYGTSVALIILQLPFNRLPIFQR